MTMRRTACHAYHHSSHRKLLTGLLRLNVNNVAATRVGQRLLPEFILIYDPLGMLYKLAKKY